ncbi:DUF2683 family protein [Candidatus Woesearchaeota archaeon]|jgi:hypothetical protein|nr:DUF2683 family protein [Candidatus Woesearchaeota archaeon]MBT7403063.1 DUF2683 family protein [Candidatus Woesearchaeota archaeon]
MKESIKAIIEISKEANRVLNIIKAEYELKTKSEAIEKLAELHNRDKVSIATRQKPTDHVEHFRKLYG